MRREKVERSGIHLFVRLEDIAAKGVVRGLASDVAEDLQILRVVGDIEYPASRARGQWSDGWSQAQLTIPTCRSDAALSSAGSPYTVSFSGGGRGT